MTPKEKHAYSTTKIVFTIISVMLMFPLLFNSETSYYRTLFIFLIGKVIDLIYKNESDSPNYFRIWDLLNQFIGLFACAFAFCSMLTEFLDMFNESDYIFINLGLMCVVVSCMFKDIFELIYLAIKVKLVEVNIRETVLKL